MEDSRASTSTANADSSFADYASTTGLSTREPLSEGPAHPLLASLNQLLSRLLIPISLSSLSLSTPTLLLTVLEALVETRIVDVPEHYRGSWERTHRLKVTEIVIQAIGQVLDGLARARGSKHDFEWKKIRVDSRLVVKGSEEELAKLVKGIIRIAIGFGVMTEAETLPPPPPPMTTTATRRDEVAPDVFDSTPAVRPPHTSRRLRDPTPSTSTPATISDPQPLTRRRRSNHEPELPLPNPAFARSGSSSIASSSSRSSSNSTLLTIPSYRPSLFDELERSGTFARPPRMLASPRRRTDRDSRSASQGLEGLSSHKSTLRLMREREKHQQSGSSNAGIKTEPITHSRTRHGRDKLESNDDVRENRQPSRNRKGKGKQTKVGGELLESAQQTCCEGCGSELLLSTKHQRADRKPSSIVSRSSSDSATEVDGNRKVRDRDRVCRCQFSTASEADASGEDESTASSSTTIVKPDKDRPSQRTRRPPRPSSHAVDQKNRSGRPNSQTRQSVPPPVESVRRVRVERKLKTTTNAEARQGTGDLSVHGESEIERFEASRPPRSTSNSNWLDTSRSSSIQPLSTTTEPMMTPPPPDDKSRNLPSTPSPYTMLLLAQRARLAEKLRALELRERDRLAARQTDPFHRD
ncbi:uncharacterized protein JCM15063_002504 [Sporobolomyces koalae]|uniref:uncharacterized protein n=1 Tax=Sporobolomyces koalae TaxID=500713 RepID=UPI00317CA001